MWGASPYYSTPRQVTAMEIAENEIQTVILRCNYYYICEQICTGKMISSNSEYNNAQRDYMRRERGHWLSHKITCGILAEEQGKYKICAYYWIWGKYKQWFYQIKDNYDMKKHLKITMGLNLHTKNEVDV